MLSKVCKNYPVSAVPCMATELKPGPCAIKAIQHLLSLDFEKRGQYF